MTVTPDSKCSWILRKILNQRTVVEASRTVAVMLHKECFSLRQCYKSLMKQSPKVEWRRLMYENKARPRAIIILWLSCLDILTTKARLVKHGMLSSAKCELCDKDETM
ncbi:unnamed protein product [Lathyrus sativus]|nr:unnamed protein product [Lathyrus sativus]